MYLCTLWGLLPPVIPLDLVYTKHINQGVISEELHGKKRIWKHCRKGITLIEAVESFVDYESAEAWFVERRWPDLIRRVCCGSDYIATRKPSANGAGHGRKATLLLRFGYLWPGKSAC